MKYTMPYPHQRHQNLARLLLIIWSFTICSPEATLAVSPSADPAPIDKDWMLVDHSSSGPQEEPPQALSVAKAPSIAQEQELFAKAQQALAELSTILNAEGKQALLAKVKEAQRACADEQTATSSSTNTLSTTLQQLNECNEQSPTATATQEGDFGPEIQAQWAVAQNLRAIAEELLRPHIPSLQVSETTISSIQNLAKSCKHTAIKTTIVSVPLLSVIVGLLSLRVIVERDNLHKLTITNFVHFFLRSLWFMGYTYIAFSFNIVLIWLGWDLVSDYARSLWEEGARRKEKAEALEAYRQGNVQKCLGILFKKRINYLYEYQIDETLQQYSFRRDIIAWLFVARGKELLGDRITDSSPGGCQWEAQRLFQLAEKLAQGRRASPKPMRWEGFYTSDNRAWGESFCELVKCVLGEFYWVLFGEFYQVLFEDHGSHKSFTDVLTKWKRLIIAEFEALEDVQERSSEESLATVRKIAAMDELIAQMTIEDIYIMKLERPLTAIKNKKKLPGQLVKAASDAMQHYLQLQRSRPESQHPMSPLLLTAIEDLANACAINT